MDPRSLKREVGLARMLMNRVPLISPRQVKTAPMGLRGRRQSQDSNDNRTWLL